MDKNTFRDIWAELDLPKLTLRERETRLEHLLLPLIHQDLRYRTIPLNFQPETQNYEVTVPGLNRSLPPLVFCSHHDYIGSGRGVVDNWTGVLGVLALLQEAIVSPLNHTTIYLWFAEEERGQRGSRYYTDYFLPTRPACVVNLECLGCQPLAYAEAYTPMAIPAQAPESHYWDTPSDSYNFVKHKIPTVTLDGLSTDDKNFVSPLHNTRDTRDAINPTLLRDTYTRIEEFVKVLDEVYSEAKPEVVKVSS